MQKTYESPIRTEHGDIRDITRGGAWAFDFDGSIFKDRSGGGTPDPTS